LVSAVLHLLQHPHFELPVSLLPGLLQLDTVLLGLYSQFSLVKLEFLRLKDRICLVLLGFPLLLSGTELQVGCIFLSLAPWTLLVP